MSIYTRKEYLFERSQWCAKAAHELCDALPPNAEDKEFIAQQVRDGVSRLWRVGDHSWLITRVEHPGPELVIVAYQGAHVRAVMLQVLRAAQREKVRSVRFHTQHIWLPKIFGDLDMEPLEYVMRVKVPTDGR